MKNICFFLIIQASLIAIIFQYQDYVTNKYIDQNWNLFLDEDLKFESAKIPQVKDHAVRIIRMRQYYKPLNDKLYILERNIDQGLKTIDFNQTTDLIKPKLDSILSEFDSLKYIYEYENIMYQLKSALSVNQAIEKVIRLYTNRTINDLRNSMWLGCSLGFHRPKFELLKDGGQNRLIMLYDIDELNYNSDIYVNNKLDTSVLGKNKIVHEAENLGKNYLDLKVKDRGTISYARFEYEVAKP